MARDLEQTKARIRAHILAAMSPTLRSIQDHIDRLRLDDAALGWTVEAGRFRLVRTTYRANGLSDVTTLVGPMPVAAFLDALSAL